MADDQKNKTVFIQIERDDHRVKDVIHMGKNIGVPFREWYAVLKTATLLVEEIFAEKGIGYFVEIETGCDCENCKANRKDYEAIRKRGGFHVVKN